MLHGDDDWSKYSLEEDEGLLPSNRMRDRSAMMPQIDTPQRVAHPIQINAAKRVGLPNRDAMVLERFGPSNETQRILQSLMQNNSALTTRVADLNKLVAAAKRGGKLEQEAHAHYCKGVLYDNMEKWKSAIESYKEYNGLCRRLGDTEGICVAANCLGVSYYNYAVGGSAGTVRAMGLSECSHNDYEQTQLMEKSVLHHKVHLELSNEMGQFVAYSNLGLGYLSLKQSKLALESHQSALALAIPMNNPAAQSLAVGNLAIASAAMQDWETARACMDKHLQLAHDLDNMEGESVACQTIGQMASEAGDYVEAAHYFEQARKIAIQAGEKGMLKLINCSIGITQGNIKMKEFMSQLI